MIESSSRFRLTPEQYQLLLQPLHRSRVGKNPKGFSHLEAWDIRRWLIRVFGFGGYRIENTVELVKEIESPPGSIKYRNGGSNDKTVWTVVYRAEVRLTVYRNSTADTRCSRTSPVVTRRINRRWVTATTTPSKLRCRRA
ncbi:hypothetical protein [Salinispora arenicola]|uniref:hypothetical protein n=1 Tax=Salinispora arenicola TaxID=168697 RepID=UPI001694C875|nr:hypothetical protein [Salinispora arenicola]NIL64923.1 hypothetical protein [Salinispora arenicola]